MIAAFLAAPAAAATLPQWTGPGDRVCAGRCAAEWALAHIPEATRADALARLSDVEAAA